MAPRILPASSEALVEAGRLLATGGLVAFPTETVYGLGANALDSTAVARIFEAKGRPAWNPLIVHVGSIEQARTLAATWPESAARLAAAFWPGPLSIVVPRTDLVPALVSAGGPTVALRMPAHPVALALVQAAGVPIAAPSANRSMALSPTTAAHVAEGLADRVDLILDGGPSTVGIESTVVDLTGSEPRVLRPGMLTPDALARVVGTAVRGPGQLVADAEPRASPGMMERHYAPRGTVEICVASQLTPRWTEARSAGTKVGAVVHTSRDVTGPTVHHLPVDAEGYARELYESLHRLDAAGVELILVEAVPDEPGWDGIRDRLRRASTP
jgi:L-threonylcarbamoyladenylate synthase